MMIEIDLLPLELRPKKKISFEGVLNTKFILTVLGCLVACHLFLQSLSFVNSLRLNNLKKNWGNLSSKREELTKLTEQLTRVNQKIPLIEQLISNRVLWSKKINEISDLIISGIWLNEISLEQRKGRIEGESSEYLIIRGSAASRAKDEPALIGRFMQNLKDEPSFSSDFSEIELGPIQKKQIKETEVMDFVLICRFRPDKAQALLR